MKNLRILPALCLLTFWTLVGCGQSDSPMSKASVPPGPATQSHNSAGSIGQPGSDVNQVIEGEKTPGEIRVLFIGNSHAAPMPNLLLEIFQRQQPNVKTSIRSARSFGFLADHAKAPNTLELIRSGEWDFVVLQAQKYSSSGKYIYPTDAAEQLSKIAIDSKAKVLMFPEWSRAGVPDEYPRIKEIHNSIAKKTGATVAPIGEAWEAAAQSFERKKLYASDGNHASQAGSYLTACVFYSMITQQSPARNENADPSSFPNSYRKLEKAAWSAVVSEME